MTPAQRRSSARSSEIVASPRMMTKLYGGSWSSTHRQTRGSRRIARPLTLGPYVVSTTSSPSSTNHTGVTCGDRSALVTASLPVLVPVITNSRHCACVIFATSAPFLCAAARVPLADQPGQKLEVVEVVQVEHLEVDALSARLGPSTW